VNQAPISLRRFRGKILIHWYEMYWGKDVLHIRPSEAGLGVMIRLCLQTLRDRSANAKSTSGDVHS
jgi:hypothetical protein